MMSKQTEQPAQPEEPLTQEPIEQSAEPKVSAFETARELAAKAAYEQELAARERQAAAEEAAYQAREAYAEELRAEKLDLMRLKQGVIADSDKVFPEQEPPRKYTWTERFGNWLYHSKWWLGVASFCVLVGAFLVYDFVTKERPDLRLLLLSNDPELYAKSVELCTFLEESCPDYTEDGEVLVSTVYIPTAKDTMEAVSNYTASYNTQLMVQFQSALCMLVLADDAANAYLEPDAMFVDLEELYPEYDCIDGYRIRLANTSLAARIGLTEPLNDGAYLALRTVTENMNSTQEMQEAYDQARTLLERLLPLLDSPAPETTVEGGA